ncbi:MAG: glycogen/starch synthase [Egibacteraceae bacterium]
MAEDLAFVAYETPSAPCGGVAAVMGHLPMAVRSANVGHVVGLTPFHRHITPANHVKMGAGQLAVVASWTLQSFQEQQVTIEILRWYAEFPWYYVKAEPVKAGVATPFFNGKRHPYDVPPSDLHRDAFLFGRAVAEALPRLVESAERGWTLLLQDWEAATAALALAGVKPHPHRLFLTLHNSLDCPVTDRQLASFGVLPGSNDAPEDPVLQRALRAVEAPVITVSEQFAHDLTQDTLQFEVMAPHLQTVGGIALADRIVGLDNGPFQDLVPEVALLATAVRADAAALIGWKAGKRRAAIEALRTHQQRGRCLSGEEPVWGDVDRFVADGGDGGVWFVMGARDDPGQKGYDVAATAVERFLSQGGNARFLFFPILGGNGPEGLSFLRLLAKDNPQHVIVLPFAWKDGYKAALQGAAYGLMPSFYEPFGSINEFYLNGTVGIARATGGLMQQIVPLRSARSFGPSVKRRAEQWYSYSAAPTGILFREQDGLSTKDHWRALNATATKARQGSPLFRSMADELLLAITDGLELWETDPGLYCRMLVAGIQHIQCSFSWERTAAQYLRIVSS